MIYTIGPKDIWLDAIRKHPIILAIGRNTFATLDDRPDYLFVYAFQTPEDAKRGLAQIKHEGTWAVFGLEADWETDTAPVQDGWWHELLNDASIIVLFETIR